MAVSARVNRAGVDDDDPALIEAIRPAFSKRRRRP
jgi:hypothetical protein